MKTLVLWLWLSGIVPGAWAGAVKVDPQHVDSRASLIYSMGGVTIGPNGALTANSVTAPVTNLTGILPLARGGTGVSAGTNAALRTALGINSASNLDTGTLPDARLSANIPRLNATNTFTGQQNLTAGLGVTGYSSFGEIQASSGTVLGDFSVEGNATFTDVGAASFTGNGAALTSLDASNITAGTLAAARGGAGTVSGILKANGSGVVSAAVAGTDFLAPTGSIAGLSGTLAILHGGTGATTAAAARTALAVPGLATTNAFTAPQSITVGSGGDVPLTLQNQDVSGDPVKVLDVLDNTGNSAFTVYNNGDVQGSGASLTNLPAANVVGSHALPDSVLSTNVPLLNAATNDFTGGIYAGNATSIGAHVPTNYAAYFRGYGAWVNGEDFLYLRHSSTYAEISTYNYLSASTVPLLFQANGGPVALGNLPGATEKLEVAGNIKLTKHWLGNSDTRGKVTVVGTNNAGTGTYAVTFGTAYATAPFVVATATTGGIIATVESVSTTGFTIRLIDPILAGAPDADVETYWMVQG